MNAAQILRDAAREVLRTSNAISTLDPNMGKVANALEEIAQAMRDIANLLAPLKS